MPPAPLHLTLDGGIDQATYERHVPTSAVLDAVNVRYHRNGGVEKRPGCALYATNFTAGDGALVAYRDSLVAIDGHTIGPASAAGGSAAFVPKDKYPEAVPSSLNVSSSAVAMSMPDVAYSSANGGYFVYAWANAKDYSVTGADIYATVQDATTGAELSSFSLLSDGTAASYGVRLVTLGTTVYALWQKLASSTIRWSKFDPSTRTWSAAASLVTDVATNSTFDAFATIATLYLVYRNTANHIVLKSFNTSLALTATGTSSETSTVTKGFSIHGSDSDYVWYSYVYSTGGSTLSYTGAFTANLATETLTPIQTFTQTTTVEQVVRTATLRYSSTRAAVLLSSYTAVGQCTMTATVDVSSTLVVDPTARRAYWTTMGSRPFIASTSPLRVCAWLYAGAARYDTPGVGEQSLQWTYTLVDLGVDDTTTAALPPRPVCWEASRYAQVEGILGAGVPSSCVNVGNAWYALARVTRGTGKVGYLRVKADFASSARFASAELGQTLHLAPGWVWDGARCFEQSYCYWPQKPQTPTFSAASGSLVAGKTYRRRVVYEWADNLGNVHRSEPSDVLEFTVDAAHDTATYKVPALSLTARQDAAGGFVPKVTIVVYGTLSTDVDGTTYYRVFSLDATPQNDPTVESITVVDKGNVNLQVQPTIYNGGGVLPNVQPRGYSAIATYRNRLWVAYGNIVNYSKAYVTGECVSFTDAFELPLEESGDVTAMWVMDDRLFISTRDRIYWIAGDGPADNGSGNDIATPNRVACTNGCIDPRSVVVTPLGTFFQSERGIELLDRSVQVAAVPVGARVQSELDAFPTITSATLQADTSGGWVTFNVVGDTSGERLVFDYATNRWSRDEVLGAGASSKEILSSVVLGGTLYFLTSDGNVYSETPNSYLDAGSWVTMTVRTAWVHPGGLQGYQFVRLAEWMADKFTSHDVTLTPYFDYAATAGTGISKTAAVLDAFPLYQLSYAPAPQRCMAVSWKISDAPPTGGPSVGTGQGSLWAGLALELEQESRVWPLPAAQKG